MKAIIAALATALLTFHLAFADNAASPGPVIGIGTELKAVDARVASVAARFVHFVDATGPLEPRERALLDQLLPYGSRRADLAEPPAAASKAAFRP